MVRKSWTKEAKVVRGDCIGRVCESPRGFQALLKRGEGLAAAVVALQERALLVPLAAWLFWAERSGFRDA